MIRQRLCKTLGALFIAVSTLLMSEVVAAQEPATLPLTVVQVHEFVPKQFTEIKRIALSAAAYSGLSGGFASIYQNADGRRALLIGREESEHIVIDAWSYMVACADCGADLVGDNNVELREVALEKPFFPLQAKDLLMLVKSEQVTEAQKEQLADVRVVERPVLVLSDKSVDAQATSAGQSASTVSEFYLAYDGVQQAWYVHAVNRMTRMIPPDDADPQVLYIRYNAYTDYVRGVSYFEELYDLDNGVISIREDHEDMMDPIIWINDLVLY